jgi:tRNA modification GTPase
MSTTTTTTVSHTQRRTIFALSSGAGKAGVALIRISGSNASKKIAEHVIVIINILLVPALKSLLGTRQSVPAVRHASVRTLHDNESGDVLDEAVVVRFAAPNSFTGCDVVELNVHGSVAVVRDVLAALRRVPSLHDAAPGEFTRQAFLNDRLDLTAVEGLADLVHAETTAQRRQALRQLRGELGRLYAGWRATVLRSLAHVEAIIDFGDDERLDDSVLGTARTTLDGVLGAARAHLADARRGERMRSGLSVCLGGHVNVGKSSLINVLAQRQLAIVSPHAGTTRDVLETALDIAGYPALISDTAGIRQSTDEVERIGIERAKQHFADADVRVFVTDSDTDARAALASGELRSNDIVVRNKVDTAPSSLGGAAGDRRLVTLSCATGAGVDTFLKQLTHSLSELTAQGVTSESPLLSRERHRVLVEQAVEALQVASAALDSDLIVAAEELRTAIQHLSALTGESHDVERVLDIVFSEFCIGK